MKTYRKHRTTAIEPRTTDLGAGIVSRRDGLEITTELPFNDWRRLGERLLETADRALWSIGDWRVYGERFSRDYHPAIDELDARSRLIGASARVARSFPSERRRGQLSFEAHELVAGFDVPEQESWLDEFERQGWTRRQMQLALGEAFDRVPVPALSVRAVGELHDLCVRAAERRGMDPKEWAMGVLERAARSELEEVAA
jgi:hypothetical protein